MWITAISGSDATRSCDVTSARTGTMTRAAEGQVHERRKLKEKSYGKNREEKRQRSRPDGLCNARINGCVIWGTGKKRDWKKASFYKKIHFNRGLRLFTVCDCLTISFLSVRCSKRDLCLSKSDRSENVNFPMVEWRKIIFFCSTRGC
ncbi:hypothetical protein NPIL_71281 [Nephila pilipes]|uniref:Uncharacterized protein n=1 Tax=Nephila pilipes TaxID=299642 RepID=A0A8X6TLU5_NEPPI|nr:hypothetical protein NPIL_71281 [Nephila pilipes]